MLFKQYKPIISILVFKLRLGEFSAEHLINHPLPLPLSSLAKDEVASTWDMYPLELLYRLPLGVSENAERFYWHLRSLTHTSEQFKSKGFRTPGESLQYLHRMAPTRPTQYSID